MKKQHKSYLCIKEKELIEELASKQIIIQEDSK